MSAFLRRSAGAFLLLVVSSPAAAQTADERVVVQDTVVVAASKTRSRLAELATSATVLGPRELRAAPARPLFEALSAVPGVRIADLSGSGTQGVIESRGFAAQGQSSYTLVLIDEVPVNELESDRVDWNLLGLSQLDRIEFLRGASSFLYGNASMSGVVNLVTRSAVAGPAGWVQAAGGSNGRRNGSGGASWQGDRAEGSVSASLRRGDGDRDRSEFDGASVYGHGRVALGERWSLGARLLAHGEQQQVPGPLPAPLWDADPERAFYPGDRRETQTLQGGVDVAGGFGDAFDVRVTLGAEGRELDATETIVPLPALDRSSDSGALRAEVRTTWRPVAWRGAQLLLGGEWVDGELESRYFDPAQDGAQVGAGDVSRTSGGVFALAQVPLGGAWAATAGGRIDWLESELTDPTGVADGGTPDHHRAISPTVGLTVALPGGGSAFGSWAASFKAPALELLYDQRPYFDFDGPGGDPPLTISNRALQPQRGDHGELGARARLLPGVWGEGTVWLAKSKDEIGFDLANFRHRNIARSTHYGLESGLAWQPVAGLDGRVSYAYTRAEFDGGEHDGNQINTVPEHVGSTQWTFRHAARGSVTAEVQMVAGQWLDEANERSIPDYGLIHLAATQRLGPLELFGAVRNLLDERYASLAYLTTEPDFTTPLPLYFPGAPRTFEAGVRFEFGSE